MKIHISEDGSLKETEITVNCNHINKEIEKMIAMLRVLDMKLTGSKDGQTYILDASKILYIDTVDKKTFFYTASEVYETQLKLYELEEQLAANDFFRASKSCIINFNQIKSLKPDIGRILVTMNNGKSKMKEKNFSPSF